MNERITVTLGDGTIADLGNELRAALTMLDRLRADGDVVLIRERVQAALEIVAKIARGQG